jgi:hypothetical protein
VILKGFFTFDLADSRQTSALSKNLKTMYITKQGERFYRVGMGTQGDTEGIRAGLENLDKSEGGLK